MGKHHAARRADFVAFDDRIRDLLAVLEEVRQELRSQVLSVSEAQSALPHPIPVASAQAAVAVHGNDDALTVRFVLPDRDNAQIDVSVDDGDLVVRIQPDRRPLPKRTDTELPADDVTIWRTTLPPQSDVSGIRAILNNDVLVVIVPRLKPQAAMLSDKPLQLATLGHFE